MFVYLLLAVLASSLMAFGLLMMKSRADSLPQARGTAIVSSIVAWIREPIWIGGVGVQTLGWVMYVIAVSHSPLSMVAVMMQGGIALFVVSSVVWFGERARPSEWAGIVAIVAGMILLSLSLAAGASQGATDDHAIVAISVVLLGLAAAPFAQSRLAQSGIAQAIGSGIAFGLAGLYTKAMTDSLAAGSGDLIMRIVANPWVYVMMATNLAGMVMLQNSFQQARGIITMPLSSALSNLVPIAGGMLAFGERLPQDPIAAAMRVSAFFLTIVASTMLATTQGSAPPALDRALKSVDLT
jgi:multidrug transporter EmrE-like cation transporter